MTLALTGIDRLITNSNAGKLCNEVHIISCLSSQMFSRNYNTVSLGFAKMRITWVENTHFNKWGQYSVTKMKKYVICKNYVSLFFFRKTKKEFSISLLTKPRKNPLQLIQLKKDRFVLYISQIDLILSWRKQYRLSLVCTPVLRLLIYRKLKKCLARRVKCLFSWTLETCWPP